MKNIISKISCLIGTIALLVLCIGIFSVYGQETSVDEAEGYDVLGGFWQVGAIDMDYNNNPNRNMVVDLKDSKELSDLYDSVYLIVDPDGTFVYTNLFIHEGTYSVHPKNDGQYILKTTRTYRLSIDDDGEVVEIESDSKPSYIIEICDDSLHFQDLDPFTGKAKANDNGYYFVRADEDSAFVQEHKAEVHFKEKTDTDDGYSYSKNSYSSIYDHYVKLMEDAVPGLVSAYNRESAGTSDINRLAEICNDKVGELADICNTGVGEMADLMYRNNDPYTTYSNWAEKLMNKYIEISQDIMDAYIDSSIW